MLKYADRVVSAVFSAIVTPIAAFLIGSLPAGLGSDLSKPQLLIAASTLIALGLLVFALLLPLSRSLVFVLLNPLRKHIGVYVEVYRFGQHIVFAPFGLYFDPRISGAKVVGHAFRSRDLELSPLDPEFHESWESTAIVELEHSGGVLRSIRYLYESERDGGGGHRPDGITVMSLTDRNAGEGSVIHLGQDSSKYCDYIVHSLGKAEIPRSPLLQLLTEKASIAPRVSFSYFKVAGFEMASSKRVFGLFGLNRKVALVSASFNDMQEIARKLNHNQTGYEVIVDAVRTDFDARLRNLTT